MDDKLIDLTRKWCVAIELGVTDKTVVEFAHLVDDHLHPVTWDLIHVVPEYHHIDFNYESGMMNLELSFREESVVKLEELASQLAKGDPDQRVTTMIEAGNPHELLLSERHVAQNNHLIIGKKYQSQSSRDFIIKLTRSHQGAVWIVPQKCHVKMKNILVPIDFSPNSIRALRNANNLVRHWNTPLQLHVLHVYSPPSFTAAKVLRSRDSFQDQIETFREDAMQDLLQTHLGDDAKYVKRMVVERHEPGVAQYIDDAAGKIEADLVVMGAKGYSRIERLLMGSVTEKFLQMNTKRITWIIK